MKKRFSLSDGPRLWLFKRRRYYEYEGPIDDIDSLQRFAIESYSEAKVQGEIPQEPALLQRAWALMLEIIEATGE